MDKRKKYLAVTSLIVFILSTAYFMKADSTRATGPGWIDENELGQICIRQVISAGEKDAAKPEDKTADNRGDKKETAEKKDDNRTPDDETAKEEVKVSGDPQVIIYHTHSTESYMPYSESNYHRTDEEGTVRDVGTVLENELKKNGINVIHDKTIHDRPSYNESYGRSLGTVQALMKKYPTAKYIIDLHRDAAPAAAKEGKYLTIDGVKTAKFSIVVGRKNENYVELYEFAKKVSQTAESIHKGFGGPIIEKEYNYNGFVSNRAMLLEIGNNKNTIEEARASAVVFADVLTEIINGK